MGSDNSKVLPDSAELLRLRVPRLRFAQTDRCNPLLPVNKSKKKFAAGPRRQSIRRVLAVFWACVIPALDIPLHAAEWEVVDRFIVDGTSTFKNMVTMSVSTSYPASLWASTSTVTPHLYVSTTGNVGIGTASPAYKLDVAGNANIAGGGTVGGNVAIGTTTAGARLDVRGADTQAYNLAVGTSAAYSMVVTTTGYLGIGTLSPWYKLDLSGGDLNVAGSGVYRRAGAAGTNISCTGDQVLTGGVVSGGIMTGGTCADNTLVGSDSCAADSVLVGNVCVDKYEASVWSTSGGGTQYGSASDDYPCGDNGQTCATTNMIYARSVSGYTPSGYMTWFQASAACRNVGKRLLTNAEWTEAANGTPDPGATGTAPNCNVSGSGPTTTGGGTSCLSAAGAENMIGSLWEWVADWGTAGAGASNAYGTAVAWPTGYNGDQTWNIGGNAYDGAATTAGAVPAVIRGGDWGYGAGAGVFTFNAGIGPGSWIDSLGFRCGRSLKSVILGSGISDVVEDLTPQLGGDLDVNGHKIVSASNGNIVVEPNGTGSVYVTGKSTFTAVMLISSSIYVSQNNLFISGGATGQLLKKNAAGYLEWGDASGVAGDNLGTHVATTTLNMNGFGVISAASGTFTNGVTASSFTAVNTSGAGLTVSSSAYLAVSGGNVGIGTANPSEKLEVTSAGNKTFQMRPGPDYVSVLINGVEVYRLKN